MKSSQLLVIAFVLALGFLAPAALGQGNIQCGGNWMTPTSTPMHRWRALLQAFAQRIAAFARPALTHQLQRTSSVGRAAASGTMQRGRRNSGTRIFPMRITSRLPMPMILTTHFCQKAVLLAISLE